jgi:glycosyltransferase involved in cell wall biosynthesis
MPSAPPDILVIIPAYNEEATIGRVIEDVRAHLPRAVIVDGSADATADRARALGAVVLQLPMNLGIGGAVQTGFLFAARGRYTHAMQIDGDGQHPASQAAALIDASLAGAADVVIGSRFLGGDTAAAGDQSTATRRIGIRLLSFVSRITSGVPIQDCTSGFRIYNRRAFAFLSERYPSDYPEVEAITLLASNGFRLAEVPVAMLDRQGGTSSITLSRAFYYMVKVTMASCISRFRPRHKG